MKKMLFIAMMLILLVSCNDTIIPDPVPEVVQDPKLTLAVSKKTVAPGDTLTIFCKTENAVKTESNVIGAPTSTKWKVTIKLNETMKIIVSAYNKIGTKTTSDLEVPVVVPIPTFSDTICSDSPWFLSDWEQLDKEGGNVVKISILTEQEKEEKLFFYKNLFYEIYSKNNQVVGNGYWKIEKRELTMGSVKYFSVILTEKKLILTYRLVSDAQGTVQIWRITYWRQ